MFALIPALVSRAVPVVVKIATHPRTIQSLAVGGSTLAASVLVRGAKMQGHDAALQRTAEALHRDNDPADYIGSPMPITTLRKRVARNSRLLGSSVVVEARQARVLITPPVHAVVALQARHAIRVFDKAVQADPEHHQLHLSDLATSTEFAQANPDSVAGCAKYHKRLSRYERAMKRLVRVRSWYDTSWTTPGQEYMDLMLTTMKQAIIEHEVQVDTTEAMYSRLLDERLDASAVAMAPNPYNAGIRLCHDVQSHFSGDEILTIRDQVLRAWLVRRFNVTDKQWKSFIKGWDKALSPVPVGTE